MMAKEEKSVLNSLGTLKTQEFYKIEWKGTPFINQLKIRMKLSITTCHNTANMPAVKAWPLTFMCSRILRFADLTPAGSRFYGPVLNSSPNLEASHLQTYPEGCSSVCFDIQLWLNQVSDALEITQTSALTQTYPSDNRSTWSTQVNWPLSHAKIMFWLLRLPQLSFLANCCPFPGNSSTASWFWNRGTFANQKSQGEHWRERPGCWGQTPQPSSSCQGSALYANN